MKNNANQSSQYREHLKMIDKGMSLSKKIVEILDRNALTIEEIKQELEKTNDACKVTLTDIETAIFLAFTIKSIPGVNNSKVYFLENQDYVALRKIRREEREKISFKKIQQDKPSSTEIIPSKMKTPEKDQPIAKFCSLCGKDANGVFNIIYKEKTICGDCINNLQEVIRRREIGDAISLREKKLKEQIDDLKAKLEEKQENTSESSKDIKPNKTEVFYLKILPNLLNRRTFLKTNIQDHNELVNTVKTVMPIVYREIFLEDFPKDSYFVEKITTNSGVEIDIYQKKTKKPKKILTIERPFPNESTLREKAEQLLREKLKELSSTVWASDVVVITFEKDDRLASICNEETVHYFWVKPLLAKIAEMFAFFDKLNDAWSGRENFRLTHATKEINLEEKISDLKHEIEPISTASKIVKMQMGEVKKSSDLDKTKEISKNPKTKKNIIQSSEAHLLSIDQKMMLSEKIITILDGKALTIKEIKTELLRTKKVAHVSIEEIKTAIYLSFRIKNMVGLNNLRIYFLEDQESIALKKIIANQNIELHTEPIKQIASNLVPFKESSKVRPIEANTSCPVLKIRVLVAGTHIGRPDSTLLRVVYCSEKECKNQGYPNCLIGKIIL